MNIHPQFLIAAVCAACWTQSTLCAGQAEPASVAVRTNVLYKTSANLTPYERECCILDLYLPAGRERSPLWSGFTGAG